MIEAQLGRCVAAWCPGATGVTGAAKLSGGASQETWTFDIVHTSGNIGAILRRAPPGYGAAPGRAAGLDAEATLMQLAHDAGLPSPRVLHVLTPDLAGFSDFALKALLRMPGVRGTRSSFIMQAVKSDLAWAPQPQANTSQPPARARK